MVIERRRFSFRKRLQERVRNKERAMKKIALALSIIFIILTFAGVAYVLYNRGQGNAGYAVVPMVFSLTFTSYYRNKK